MTSFSSYISDKVRNMKELDRELFNVEIDLPAIRCQARSCGRVRSAFKNILLNRPRYCGIVNSNVIGDSERLVLLSPLISHVSMFSDYQQQVFKTENGVFQTHTICLKYEDFSVYEIFKKIFPEDYVDVVSSFETVGHIAHLNLKDHMLMFKKVIGEVILDKNTNIHTVVNKTNSIEETYRYFNMELLAGEDEMVTKVIEHGCVFQFDYSKVYWNSRLQTEHQRLVAKVEAGDIVFDVFAGVGPFSIPMAKKKCKVFANDLNVESVKSLEQNIVLNKVKGIQTFNMDGRAFLRDIVIEHIMKHDASDIACSKHIIMNLPSIAPQFLDVFRDAYSRSDQPLVAHEHIFVYCYCFTKSKTPESDSINLLSNSLGMKLPEDAIARYVRRVAPNKVMMCVTFNLLWFQDLGRFCREKQTFIEESATNGPPSKKPLYSL